MVRELHLPGHNYTGPFTRFEQRQKRGDKPVNRVDAISEQHDYVYWKHQDNQLKLTQADMVYVARASQIAFDDKASRRERAEAIFVGGVIGIKTVVDIALAPQLSLYRKLRYG